MIKDQTCVSVDFFWKNTVELLTVSTLFWCKFQQTKFLHKISPSYRKHKHTKLFIYSGFHNSHPHTKTVAHTPLPLQLCALSCVTTQLSRGSTTQHKPHGFGKSYLLHGFIGNLGTTKGRRAWGCIVNQITTSERGLLSKSFNKVYLTLR